MLTRSSIKFTNSSERDLIAVVEPWANEYDLPRGSACELFSIGAEAPHRIEMELIGDQLIFHVETEGAVYEYWGDGVRLD